MELTGYKWTEVGTIPHDWDVVPLWSTAKRITRGASPRPIDSPLWFDDRSSIGWVRISDVTRSRRYLEETTQRLSDAGIRSSRFVGRGGLIMSICATVGRPIETRVDSCIHDGFVVFEEPTIDQSFLYHVLASLEPTWSRRGQTGSQMNLNTGLIRGRLVAIPSTTSEQRVITAALDDVDALLDGLDRLIGKKREVKQAAMQQLLTGQIRLPGFSGEWETKQLGDLLAYERPDPYIVKSTEYSNHGDIPVLTANKAFILGYTTEVFGVCADLPAIVFDDFTTDSKFAKAPFKVKSSAIKLLRPRHDRTSLRFLFERIQLIRFPVGDHRRYYISDYQNIGLTIPEYDEQLEIISALSDMDAEVAALEARRDKTRDLKQAMMQELLTGKTRLVQPEEAHA